MLFSRLVLVFLLVSIPLLKNFNFFHLIQLVCPIPSSVSSLSCFLPREALWPKFTNCLLSIAFTSSLSLCFCLHLSIIASRQFHCFRVSLIATTFSFSPPLFFSHSYFHHLAFCLLPFPMSRSFPPLARPALRTLISSPSPILPPHILS